MNYNDFLNKQIINQNNEVGVVLSYDKDHIVIKYSTGEKTYNPDVAFKSGFLVFKDEQLKQSVDQDLLNRESIAKKEAFEQAENQRKYLARKKKVNETYQKLVRKNRMLLALFGSDFVYPPLKEFEKKYGDLIYVKPRYLRVPYWWNYYD